MSGAATETFCPFLNSTFLGTWPRQYRNDIVTVFTMFSVSPQVCVLPQAESFPVPPPPQTTIALLQTSHFKHLSYTILYSRLTCLKIVCLKTMCQKHLSVLSWQMVYTCPIWFTLVHNDTLHTAQCVHCTQCTLYTLVHTGTRLWFTLSGGFP